MESDLIVEDKETGELIKKTINVNTPLTFNGVTIYQSSFEDGGSELVLDIWNLHSAEKTSKMESIIFDIMILNASYNYDLIIDNNLLSDELIYKKYDIDSLQFYESELYYSRNPKIHFNIYSNVKKRILKSIDSLKNIK